MKLLEIFKPESLVNIGVKDKINYLVKLTQAMTVAAVIAGIIGMLISNYSLQTLNENSLEPLEKLRSIKESFEQKIVIPAQDLAQGKRLDYDVVYKNALHEKEHIKNTWEEYKTSQLTPKEKELLPQTQQEMDRSLHSIDMLIVLLKQKNVIELIAWTTDDIPYSIALLMPSLDKMMQLQIANAQDIYNATQVQFFIILALIILIIIGSMIFISKMVKRVVDDLTTPFQELLVQSSALENKKLDEPFIWNRKDEIGQVGQSFEKSRKALHEMFEQIHATNHELEQINTLVRSSINYASRIQRSFLPNPDMLDHFSNDAFIVWRPKDVIGGDCYWVDKTEKGFFVAVIDCTGHGVPGALMTFVVVSILDRLLSQHQGIEDPASLLSTMNRLVKESLGQFDATSESNDGMDGAFCYIDLVSKRLTFAGANIPLLYINNEGFLHHIHPDKSSIGYIDSDMDLTFTNHTLDLQEGMKFYLTTDGIVDQIGGQKKISFGKKRLMELLKAHHHLPMIEQGKIIMSHLDEYKGGEKQRDDNTMIGFEI